jgi:ubiquinone/menaquinone biosynthesis C-methylase UbiE
MSSIAPGIDRLTKFYGSFSPSLETVEAALVASGVDPSAARARDLYERDLDCHNLGMHAMLEVLAGVASEYGPPGQDDVVLDIGCGLGGPGRFLADRFGCSVVGIDLLPLRIEVAEALTGLTGMRDRVTHHVADATSTEFADGSFRHAWMLDVGIHIRDKTALFGEIARVLERGGRFVMHDQTGPLPKVMLPLKRRAPYYAPSLPQLIRHVEGAGLRLLTWRDTTEPVLDYFLGILARFGTSDTDARPTDPEQRDFGIALLQAYVETLSGRDGRTGILVAAKP